MADPGRIVIVGGGHAAAQLCASLAEAGLGAQVHLVGAEPLPPYQRPPLSKAFLKDEAATVQSHRADAWFADKGITLTLGDAAVALDRQARVLTLASGAQVPYDHLVLATGARARSLPGLPEGLANVASVRSAEDAQRLRAQLAEVQSVTVLGGGFIGLEVAATARGLGKEVQVLEVAPRLLGRSVSAELAEHVLHTHRAAGTQVHLGVKLGEVRHAHGRVQAVVADGAEIPVELLVLGIGAQPDITLAQAAGLACEPQAPGGIVVDACMRSSDPHILAIGDVASFPAHARAATATGRCRLESVQNAADQARTAAATLQGREEPYTALPWFWSEQGAMRLQMAGLLPPQPHTHRRPGASAASFSLLHYTAEGVLACVESVNAPADHLAARKLLELGKSPAPAQAVDAAVALKTFF